ncbi:type IA DNA topoisomerase [Segetibacter sp. 3557_3]|uniref:type IA DNA topoisomerase n=1 Tax=Segetibacter sp. 3557_3 TaxID=2547429 RepID=UPI00105877DB|nr:type IA DNA topoisomerase [Segetibacter sp. 3557_3]TDH18075.1 type IA DNA topoisomerase [Segetibacter sp. 3557_3]
MKVVIAEKPSVARSIAAVLHATNKRDGYLQGGAYAVTWAFGHLVTLCEPDHYGWVKWTKETLPMLPENFDLQPAHRYDPVKKESKVDPGISKQLEIIKQLFIQAELIIVATDAGREGELIFRYIYEYLNIRKPFKRLWISSLTDKAIQDGFRSLQDGSKYDKLYYAAKARSEADWLVGMNATRALSVAAGKSLFSIGRVQTPTLAIVCSRFLDNQNFKPKAYYVLRIDLSKNAQAFSAYGVTNYEQREKAQEVLRLAVSTDKAIVTSVEKNEVSEAVPLLFDLTSLQQEANKKFGLSADETLKAAQSLYEKTYITYPRTGSRFIGDDVFAEVPSLISVAKGHAKYGVAASSMPAILNRRSVNASKVTDHHALLITDHLPKELSGDEERIYDLVLSRMLEAFHDNSISDKTVANLDSGGIPFKATGSVIKHKGWRSVREGEKSEESQREQSSEDNPDNSQLPELRQGERVQRTGAECMEKFTRPKPIHTEASLLKAMETAGKDIEDEAAREAMKDCGLGTPATRAAIIETLLNRSYIEKQKKKLVPTPKGLATYELVKGKPVSSAVLTGQWEKKLSDIGSGGIAYAEFMMEIKEYAATVSSELLSFGASLASVATDSAQADNLACPKCKKGTIRKGEKNYWCTGYKDGCDFKIWLEIAGKKLSEANVKQLVQKRKTSLIKGFKSKASNDFEAVLKMDDTYKLTFDLGNKK